MEVDISKLDPRGFFTDSEKETIILIGDLVYQRGYKYVCYTLMEKVYLGRRGEYSWHTIERCVRRLANKYKLLIKLDTRRGCYKPSEAFKSIYWRLKTHD